MSQHPSKVTFLVFHLLVHGCVAIFQHTAEEEKQHGGARIVEIDDAGPMQQRKVAKEHSASMPAEADVPLASSKTSEVMRTMRKESGLEAVSSEKDTLQPMGLLDEHQGVKTAPETHLSEKDRAQLENVVDPAVLLAANQTQQVRARPGNPTYCPPYYPKCWSDGDCVVDAYTWGVGWKKSPHWWYHPWSNWRGYNYVSGYGGDYGGRCTGNYQPDRDCKWHGWSNFGACSKPCGTGEKTQSRGIRVYRSGQGKPCADANLHVVTVACNLAPCGIDCAWTGWGPFSECTRTCGGGTRQRTRIQAATAEHLGAQCQGDSVDEEHGCNSNGCAVDCEVADWGEWGNCTEECGGGNKMRRREIDVPQEFHGIECPALEENGTVYEPEGCNPSDVGCDIATYGCNAQDCPLKAGTTRLAEISTMAALSIVLATMWMTPPKQEL